MVNPSNNDLCSWWEQNYTIYEECEEEGLYISEEEGKKLSVVNNWLVEAGCKKEFKPVESTQNYPQMVGNQGDFSQGTGQGYPGEFSQGTGQGYPGPQIQVQSSQGYSGEFSQGPQNGSYLVGNQGPNQMTVPQMGFGQMPVNQMAGPQTAFNQMTVPQIALNQMSVKQNAN